MWRASPGLLLLAASLLYGCGGRGCRHVTPVAGPNEDPFDLVTSARIDSSYSTPYTTWSLGTGAYRFRAPRAVKPPVGPAASGSLPSKWPRVLDRWLVDSSAAIRKRFIVTFRDTLSIPRIPPASSMLPGAGSAAALALGDILARRKVAARSDTAGFAALQIDVIESFWLSPSAVVEMALGRVRDLQSRKDIATIEPVIGMRPPTGTPVAAVRADMSTDPYYDLPASGDKIALLDTGVRSSHEMLVAAPIRILGDCVDGGPSCTGAGADPGDACRRPGGGTDQGHGTRSAALISGMTSSGTWHGVTKIPLDSYRVYAHDAAECAVADPIAVQRAFDVAVANGARVLVAELQDTSAFYGAIARAADAANALGGAVVVAAAGNTPGPRTVSSPASARRVLGIGVHESTGLTDPIQSQGPTPDGRIKPDVQAPEDVVTASSSSNSATIDFDGTSCATALAGASAALLREWLMAGKESIDPGQVYAQMILSGTRESPFTANAGAGPLRLPAGGRVWWGKASLGHHEEFKFEFPVSEAWMKWIDVAIWWPEDLQLDANGLPLDERHDIDLYLYDPTGSERGRCETGGTVFERTSTYVPASRRGTWRLEVYAYDTRGRHQTVYWTAVARPSQPGDHPPESTEVEP